LPQRAQQVTTFPFFFAARLPGLKKLGQAARVVQRVVHGVEQRQIAELGTTVNIALRKNVAAHHHFFSIDVKTMIIASSGLQSQVASYKMVS
jgi:hypothetical protein